MDWRDDVTPSPTPMEWDDTSEDDKPLVTSRLLRKW
jgi:hypothetical protein